MRQARGFTLIELMVTIAVLAIILGFAIPSFTDQIRNNRSLAFGEEYITALNFARSEAVKRGDLVSVCASDNAGTGCGSDWTNGWLVYTDSEEERASTTTVDTVLRYWDPPGDDMTLTVQRGGSAVGFVRFNGIGSLARIDTNPVVIEAKHNDCTQDSARALNVSLSGSVQSRRANC